jgi:hypothetical protein
LLFALKDVIGQDDDDQDDSFDDSLRQSSSSDHSPARSFQNTSTTVCEPNEGDPLSSATPSHPLLSKSINELSHPLISIPNPTPPDAEVTASDNSRNDLLTSSSSRRPPTPGSLSDILSPTDTTHFPNVPFLRDRETPPPLASADPETWSSPLPLTSSPPRPADFDLLTSPPFNNNNNNAHFDLSSMLIQGPFFPSDPEDESNEESTTRLPQRDSLSPVLPRTLPSPGGNAGYEDDVLSSYGSIQPDPDAQTDAVMTAAVSSSFESSTSRQDSLNSLYDSYSTFDSPEEFQPESSSSPPSSSSVSSHDPRGLVASPLAEQQEGEGSWRAFRTRRYGTAIAPTYGEESLPSPISPVPSSAATTDGVAESSGKVAFGFRKYASVGFFLCASFLSRWL